MWLLIAILIIAGIAILIVIYYKNKIVRSFNTTKNAWAQINVQLKKRTDLVPNLVETVKAYAKHEKTVFYEVTKARSAILGAQTVEKKAAANNQLTGALKSLFAVAENYPDLKASENFRTFQEQLDGIESKIAYARQFYNDAALNYNNVIQTIPGVWFAGSRTQQPYFEIEESEKAVPKVKFD